jgi:uncharacterized protein YbbK (DUF523 family)
MRYARPTIVISRCIDFDACRYNGQVIRSSLREKLEPHVRFEPICPELEIGLGVPRDPIWIVGGRAGRKLVQPSTGQDLTLAMRTFSDRYLATVGEVDGFILKARSPSCAPRDARVHPDESSDRTSSTAPGMFAGRVLDLFPLAAVEDELRLDDPHVLAQFLTRIFTFAALRESAATGEPLADFHARNEPLLMAHDEDALREAAKVAANEDRLAAPRAYERYREVLVAALSHPAQQPYRAPYPQHLAPRRPQARNLRESEAADPAPDLS